MKRLALLLIALLTGCGQEPPAPTPQPAPPLYDTDVRDGSVIFWVNSRLVKPILRYTGSDITHAAIILYDKDQPYVYEAVPPRVHKVLLVEYLESLKQQAKKPALEKRDFHWFLMQPLDRYAPGQLAAMKARAESQLGRPYMLRGWWKGHEVRGVFCSQLVGDIIARSGLIAAGGIHESPGSLHDKLLPFYENMP